MLGNNIAIAQWVTARGVAQVSLLATRKSRAKASDLRCTGRNPIRPAGVTPTRLGEMLPKLLNPDPLELYLASKGTDEGSVAGTENSSFFRRTRCLKKNL